MYASPLWSKISSVVDCGVRTVEISLLWMLFSAVGLVILGVGPATAAASVVARKFVLRTEVPVFRTFISAYRTEFVRANKLAWILMAVGIVLAWDTRISINAHSGILHLLIVPILLVDVVCAAIALYVFPLYAHRHIPKVVHYFRLAVVTAVLNPGRSVVMLALLYGWVFVLGGVLPFLSVGLLIYLLVRLAISGSDRVVRVLDPEASLDPGVRTGMASDPSDRIESCSAEFTD